MQRQSKAHSTFANKGKASVMLWLNQKSKAPSKLPFTQSAKASEYIEELLCKWTELYTLFKHLVGAQQALSELKTV